MLPKYCVSLDRLKIYSLARFLAVNDIAPFLGQPLELWITKSSALTPTIFASIIDKESSASYLTRFATIATIVAELVLLSKLVSNHLKGLQAQKWNVALKRYSPAGYAEQYWII